MDSHETLYFVLYYDVPETFTSLGRKYVWAILCVFQWMWILPFSHFCYTSAAIPQFGGSVSCGDFDDSLCFSIELHDFIERLLWAIQLNQLHVCSDPCFSSSCGRFWGGICRSKLLVTVCSTYEKYNIECIVGVLLRRRLPWKSIGESMLNIRKIQYRMNPWGICRWKVLDKVCSTYEK